MKNKKFDFKENPVSAAVILFIIAVVVTLALAGTNELTKDKIIAQATLEQEQAMLKVFPAAASFTDISSSSISSKTPKIKSVNSALDSSNNQIGLVVVSTFKGYSGEITIIVGISNDRKVTGIQVLSDNETPGLGKKVAENIFTQRFINKDAGLLFSVKKSDKNVNVVDAITGATISSNAMVQATNNALTIAFDVFTKTSTGGDK